MKQHSLPSGGRGPSPWQLEEVQVFWAKQEHSLALGLLRQMIEKLSDQVRLAWSPGTELVLWFCCR